MNIPGWRSCVALLRDIVLFPLLAIIAVVGAAALLVAFGLALIAWGVFTVLRDVMSWRGRQ